ncbi:Pls/PosA family non-ribosomal peptide synthetase [Streptomyces sp. NBC_00268]|uniref:Pls/PosA family non-ribosomal peptide synthetase n=1 Tax=Streptomyces sp. NBC_00268 TaxID=2975695 RepID=UPI00224ED125|nr:Pls/PosA family non-ribosomal peptide synthetase [Streptomyces sp. NBC_00268]MCX5190407.1 phosphopantetheine-binding protein [Streptomyces sp. NBC_00268]
MLEKSVEVLTADPADISTLQDGGDTDPGTDTERRLAEVLAGVVRVEQVPADSHFFNDLGADSLVMAQFCARVRKQGDLPTVSMKDIYRYPTIRSLSAALADALPVSAPAPVPSPSVGAPASTPAQTPTDVQTSAEETMRAETPAAARTRRYLVCGTLQFLIFLGYSFLVALAVEEAHQWISAGSGLFDLYLRSVLLAGAGFLGLCALPVVVKWTLVGRWRSGEFPLWGMAYLRFWVVKTLIRTSPVRLFAGSPLYVLYLRVLGARIGKGVTILSHTIPVCTDLLTIGDGTIVRKDVLLSCYRAHAGVIQTGPVTLGSDVLVSEHTVLDIETAMGDGAQLGHASSLHTGQAVPAGERRHGSPAQPTEVDYRTVGPADCPSAKRTAYSVVQLLSLMAVYLPLALGGVSALIAGLPQLQTVLDPQPMTSPAFYVDALIAAVLVLFGSLLAGLLVVGTVPRVLSRAIEPGKVYPLYGFHYGIQRAIAVMTNRKSLNTLFGDSSGIVHYLRYLGYDLSGVEQTGSNFGTEVQQENPYLSSVGTGTMIADGLSIMNADFSSTSFRVSRTSIGPRNFLGNRIAYPAQGRTGDNCLLATKVMVPIDGPVREGVGLLGSPSFEIPRTVMRDNRFNHLETGDELRRRLAAKNRHNAATAGLYLLARLIHFFVITLITMGAVDLYPSFGALAIALASVLTLTYTVVHFALVERASTGFKPQQPLYCSIYESSFWRHERFWKMASVHYIQAFDGTPFKNVIWRLLGARIGKRVFDDGCFFPERTLVTIGDDSTLNAGTVVQCHSQEDGAFKSERSALGSGCTLGVGAFVHYGVTIADGASLAPDSFLMKGEEIPSRAQWGGNPAREMPDHKTRFEAGRELHVTQAAPAPGN